MPILILYLLTLVTFLILDGIMLGLVLVPAFQAAIGPLLAAQPAWLPAVLFYLLFPMAAVALASGPAWRQGGAAWPRAAILGAAAYGTYELTNWSILAGYPAWLALTDWAWGTVLTAVAAQTGLALARRFGQSGGVRQGGKE